MAYSDKVLDHYNNPRNVGSLDKKDPNVGTGMVGAPECGDVMKLQVKVNPETGIIEDAKFKTFGCGSAIASSSLATEWLHGKTVDEIAKFLEVDSLAYLSLDGMLACMKHAKTQYCTACWSGHYKIPFDQPDAKFNFEREQLRLF